MAPILLILEVQCNDLEGFASTGLSFECGTVYSGY